MNDITLRAPGTDLDDLPLVQGRLAVGRSAGGGLGPVDEASSARACFCVDRRGTWLEVGEGVRGVHVNGRPVQRRALLRAGDTVYVEGVEILLCCGKGGSPDAPAGAAAAPTVAGDTAAPDPRILLRGTSGPHHGRSLTLARPRLVGSSAEADIRIPGLAPRHAGLGVEGGQVVVKVLADGAEVLVNGEPRRSAVLQPGDQVAFDGAHRFVLEAPTPVLGLPVEGEVVDDFPPVDTPAPPQPRRHRLPWLLLAALFLAAALSALLLL